MSDKKHKILIAAGGTGGHLFPAQAFAQDLLKKDPTIEVLFAGGGLGSNRCFHKELFPYREIETAHLSRCQKGGLFCAFLTIFKGVRQSLKLLSEYKPQLVIGFGSFHAFPLLAAAKLKKIPFVIFEPDSSLGKVNRLFSRWAVKSAVQFSEAAKTLGSSAVEVNMPLWEREGRKSVTEEEARAYFCLDPCKPTFLVFGGSQGATAVNTFFCEAISQFAEKKKEFQVVHFTGNPRSAEEARRIYACLGISACVKDFEERMHLAWRAASVVVCRAGAATLAEQVAFEVPGILIPYPYSAGQHQMKNALFMQNRVGGGLMMDESQLTADKLARVLKEMLDPAKGRLEKMIASMRTFKNKKHKNDLATVVYTLLKKYG